MRAFLITFRPHPMESELLPIFLNYFLTFVNEYPHRWIIEKDNSPDAHFHSYIETGFRDVEKLRRNALFKKSTKPIQTLLGSGYQTLWTHAFDVKIIADTPQDLNVSLGYLYKDNSITRLSCNLPEQQQNDAVKAFFTEERLKLMKMDKKNWTAVTTKNAHALIEDFCAKQEISLVHTDWVSVKLQMVKHRYTFAQISEKAQKTVHAELAYHHESTTLDSITAKAHLVSEMHIEYGDYFDSPNEQYCSECAHKMGCTNIDCQRCPN